MNDLDLSITDKRVMDLAKKICELYTAPELEKLAPISPQTIQRWAEGKHRPSKSTALTLAQIIAVSDDDYKKYLNGNLTLDELWDLKGTAKRLSAKQEVTMQSVLNDAKRLSTMERLKLMSSLFLTIAPGEVTRLQDSDEQPDFVQLSETAKKRLRTLLDLSNIYLQQSYQSIVENGANKNLVEDLVNNGLENEYIEPVFRTILPFLCRVNNWNGIVPLDANPAQYFESVSQLTNSLNS